MCYVEFNWQSDLKATKLKLLPFTHFCVGARSLALKFAVHNLLPYNYVQGFPHRCSSRGFNLKHKITLTLKGNVNAF